MYKVSLPGQTNEMPRVTRRKGAPIAALVAKMDAYKAQEAILHTASASATPKTQIHACTYTNSNLHRSKYMRNRKQSTDCHVIVVPMPGRAVSGSAQYDMAPP